MAVGAGYDGVGMSRRIDCTLTDAQWHELAAACAERACVLEEQGDYEGDEGVAAATRQRGVHERMWDRILGGSA